MLMSGKFFVEGVYPLTKISADINIITYLLGYVYGYGCFFYV
jgi:hypothetical protein